MNSKIALVFCGQGRSVESAYESIKEKIIDVYNPDIYCHLWWDDSIEKNGYHGHNRDYRTPKELPSLIKNYYNPKKFLIQPPISDWNTPDLINIKCSSKETFISQLYSIQESFNLLNWSEYDFIIKCRYDLKIINFPNLYLLDNKKFYTGFNNGEFYYDDPYFFSDLCYILPNNMKKYMQIIDNINNFSMFSDCVPEHILFDTLKLLNLTEKMVRFSSNEFHCDVIR